MSEEKKSQKQEALRQVVQGLEKTYGQGTIMQLGSGPQQPIAVIRSGALLLDEALGVGGYPRGRVVEIFGPESSGKTTLTLHAIAEAQRAGGIAAFIDAEHAFDLRYAQGIGIDLKKLLMSQPDCGEQALEIAEALTRSGAVDLIVVDSVAALVPKAEIEGDMGDAHMGLQARLMSQALRKLTAVASKSGTTLIFINQLRQKIGVVFGNPETTTGGNALKFYASVRLDVRRTGKVSMGETVVGNRTRVKVVKNKCAPPFTEAEFDIRWGTGIDAGADLVEAATHAGVLEKNGSHYLFGGKSVGQGRDKTRDLILMDPVLFEAVRKKTLELLPSQAHRLAKSGTLDDAPEKSSKPDKKSAA
ncbi:MAG TPA: recombinase RecA [Polyangiaceae bacterium]|nr:recombinase RecA [Polyangiaceae bacterium]